MFGNKCLLRIPRLYRKLSGKIPPTPPFEEECCNSNCPNCVWLEYSDDLMKFYGDKVNKFLKNLGLQ